MEWSVKETDRFMYLHSDHSPAFPSGGGSDEDYLPRRESGPTMVGDGDSHGSKA